MQMRCFYYLQRCWWNQIRRIRRRKYKGDEAGLKIMSQRDELRAMFVKYSKVMQRGKKAVRTFQQFLKFAKIIKSMLKKSIPAVESPLIVDGDYLP